MRSRERGEWKRWSERNRERGEEERGREKSGGEGRKDEEHPILMGLQFLFQVSMGPALFQCIMSRFAHGF